MPEVTVAFWGEVTPEPKQNTLFNPKYITILGSVKNISCMEFSLSSNTIFY